MTGEFAVAVHALVYLNHKAQILPSEVLAENICTNPARVRKVMAKLKRAGIVATKEGMDGGYVFAKNPEKVNLREVCDALSMCMVGTGWKPGDREKKCLISSGMADIMDGIYMELDIQCKKKLEEITIADIDNKIFGKEVINDDTL